jgi:hypothetical protein
MRRNELIKMNNTLGNTPADKILKKKKGLFIYYNRPNRQTKKIKIHNHFCGQCAWGSGKLSVKEAGRNGVWIGPFKSEKQIIDFVKDNFNDLTNKIERCSCLD